MCKTARHLLERLKPNVSINRLQSVCLFPVRKTDFLFRAICLSVKKEVGTFHHSFDRIRTDSLSDKVVDMVLTRADGGARQKE